MQHYENHLEKIYEQNNLQKQHDVQNRIDFTRHFDGLER